MIPLSLDEIQHIWDMLKLEEFDVMLGGWMRLEIASNAKEVMRSSAVLFLRHAGWETKGLMLH